jgi:deoxyribonuclease V
MILALDVYYRDNTTKAVGVLFNWEDFQPIKIIIEFIDQVEEYIPGKFYKRELPCLLKIIEKININEIEAIIIDGYVYIDNDLKYGLGAILWETLNKQIPVIGVAKTSFFRNKQTIKEVNRGVSKKPLYVSTIGYNINKAVEKIKDMKGEFRIPSILKELDIITKEEDTFCIVNKYKGLNYT